MNIQIQKANIDNIDSIRNIENSLAHPILPSLQISSYIQQDSYHFYVATINNVVVGYICWEFMVDHIDLIGIAVLATYRNQHIGSALLDVLNKFACDKKINNVFLEVRCNNLTAISFYEKFGFEKISTRKNYYSDTSEDAYVYKKTV